MTDHLSEFAEKFQEAVQSCNPIDFYTDLSNLLVSITKKQN